MSKNLKDFSPIEVAAVGRVAKLGEFYDARTEKFLHISLFKEELPKAEITSTSNKDTNLKYTLLNTYEEKFSKLDISAELKMSILGGLFELNGSGKYFKDEKKSVKSAKASLIQSILTKYETVKGGITGENIRRFIDSEMLEQVDATHIVVAIQWGGRVIISVEDTSSNNSDRQTVEGQLEAHMKKIASGLNNISGSLDISIDDIDKINNFHFEIFGDVLPEDTVPQTLIEAVKFMKNAPGLLQSGDDRKGKAMKYTLMPVASLRQIWKLNSVVNSFIKRIDEAIIEKYIKLFDNTNLVKQKINDYCAEIVQMESFIKADEVKKLTDLKNNYELYETTLKAELSELLIQIRSGNEEVRKLDEKLLLYLNDDYSWENTNLKLKDFDKLKQEILFTKLMMSKGVIIIGKNLTQFLRENFGRDVYVLFYIYDEMNDADGDEDDDYDDNAAATNTFLYILERRQEYGPKTLFAAVNCEILNKNKDSSKISLYRDGKLIEENYHLGFKPDECNSSQCLWSLSNIQKVLLEQGDQLTKIRENPVPIGFIYVQLPEQPEPKTLWPTLKWENVTSDYAGLFFRAEGGDSKSFGSIQEENSPRLTAVHYAGGHSSEKESITVSASGSRSNWINSGPDNSILKLNWNVMDFTVSSGEVRPRNQAVRIWKRTN